MSGHSKWATTKHKKALIDSKRGKSFTKIIREITIAARIGGGDPEGNPRLRTAILKAKDVNMPSDNIQKAIMRGTGELPGTTYEELRYEGYGPGGVAMLIDATTDNKNRTAPEFRQIFSKDGGNMGESGCVSWMFQKRGYLTVDKNKIKEDDLMNIVLDAGGEDMQTSDTGYTIFTDPQSFEAVNTALKKNKIEPSYAEITMVPQTYVKLEGKEAAHMLHLMEALEDHDDVQNVYANFDISDQLIEQLVASK
ncbi:MAG: YebC/PmpR family DNA-binding transcriptional regulator [Nitrospirae bacterium]|nr:YebC/PmpR family DNA-binding transcriptional regulator [Nitrospirota bacterium]